MLHGKCGIADNLYLMPACGVGAKLCLRQASKHPENCEINHTNKSNKHGRVAQIVSGVC